MVISPTNKGASVSLKNRGEPVYSTMFFSSFHFLVML